MSMWRESEESNPGRAVLETAGLPLNYPPIFTGIAIFTVTVKMVFW